MKGLSSGGALFGWTFDANATRRVLIPSPVTTARPYWELVNNLTVDAHPTGAVHGLWQPITFPGFEVVYEPNAPGWFDHVSEETESAAKYYENMEGRS